MSRRSRSPFQFTSLLLLTGIGCTAPVFGPSIHEWGNYDVCITRVSDTCHMLPGASDLPFYEDRIPAPSEQSRSCSTQPYLLTPLQVGVSFTSDTFYIAREHMDPIAGTESGTRFEVIRDSSCDGIQQAFCDCPVDIVETTRGALYADAGAVSLSACVVPTTEPDGGILLDAGPLGCVDTPPESPYCDPIEVADAGPFNCTLAPSPSPFCESPWLEAETVDGGYNIADNYPGIQGRIVDTVTPIPLPDGGTCGCAPCTVVYDFAGLQ